MPAPQFGVADRPRDIVDGSGRWLAEQFGWRWVKSRGQLEFRDGPQLLQLSLQSSGYSRAGVATWIYTRVTVSDDDLPRRRAAHPEATLFPSPADQPRRFVYNSLLINVEPDLGWLARVHGLADPREFREPAGVP